MKNIIKLFGCVALVTVITFSFALTFTSCDDGSGGPGGGPGGGGQTGGGGGGGRAGKLTINGLPNSNPNMTVYLGSTDLSSSAAMRKANSENKQVATGHRDSFDSSGSSFTFDLIRVREGWPTGETFTDSGSYKVVLWSLGYDSSGSYNYLLDYVAPVNLTNGSATVQWSSFRTVEN